MYEDETFFSDLLEQAYLEAVIDGEQQSFGFCRKVGKPVESNYSRSPRMASTG
jgi:hypothetical protein